MPSLLVDLGAKPAPMPWAAGPRSLLAGGNLMTVVRPERLGPDHRLHTAGHYSAVKQEGTSYRGRHCLMLVLPKPGDTTRFGFIASRKGVGNAVQRNRARRRLREIVRRRMPRIPLVGYWVAFVCFRTATTTSHQELASDVERLLATAGALAPIEAS